MIQPTPASPHRAPATVLALLLPLLPALAQPIQPPTTASSHTPDDAEIIADPARPADQRQAAADRLILAADIPSLRDRITSLLASPIDDTSPASFILRALATQSSAPAPLFAPLSRRLTAATPAEVPLLLEALASFRTRASAHLLLAHAGPDQEKSIAASALAALRRLSGRDDLPDSAPAWARWLESADRLDESAWNAVLAKAHADRTDRLTRESAELSSRLLATLRRVHLMLNTEERSPFLASLLNDPIAVVRDLGFELTARELAAGTILAPEVSAAAIALLESRDAPVRTHAARLLSQLAPPSAAAPITAALAHETDSAAATALMDAASRWPNADLGPLVIRWLSADPAARRAAVAATWTLYRSGNLAQPERAKALESLRAAPVASIGGACCHLLAAIGSDHDRQVVGSLLSSDDMSLRRSAAEALANDSAFADAILTAAASDPELFSVATRVVLMHRLNTQGFELLRTLPAPSATQQREGLAEVLSVLPAPAALEVASATRSDDDREAFLELLLADARIMSERTDPSSLDAILSAATQLAALRLSTNRPDLALTAIDTALPLATPGHKQALIDLATSANLASGKVEAAAELNGSAQVWLDALRDNIRKPIARDVLSVLTFRFASTLSDPQLKQLAELQRQLDEAQLPPPPPKP